MVLITANSMFLIGKPQDIVYHLKQLPDDCIYLSDYLSKFNISKFNISLN